MEVMDQTLERPIFVVGSPRSGTTLVQCIVSASSHAFSLPETHFFTAVLPALGIPFDEPLAADGLARVRHVLEEEAEDLFFPDEFWEPLESTPGITPRGVFLALIEWYRPDEDRVARSMRAVEKTPLHVLHLETVLAAFSTMKVVNVVRNPVDVASSWMTSPFGTTKSVLTYARGWEEAVEAGEAFAALHPERIFTVIYESLVRDPQRWVRDICEFLDLPYEERMLQEFGQQAERNVGKRESWKQEVRGGVVLNREGIWRQRMTPGQAWIVSRATQATRRRYGYPPSPAISTVEGLRALAQEASARFRESRAKSIPTWDAARFAGQPLKAVLSRA